MRGEGMSDNLRSEELFNRCSTNRGLREIMSAFAEGERHERRMRDLGSGHRDRSELVCFVAWRANGCKGRPRFSPGMSKYSIAKRACSSQMRDIGWTSLPVMPTIISMC